MMLYEHAVEAGSAGLTSPGSPPGLTTSKSSKSSSFRSFSSDDSSILADVGHFEEIGLDDETPHHFDRDHDRDLHAKPRPNPFTTSYPSDLRAASASLKGAPSPRPQSSRELGRSRPHRDITHMPNKRPTFPGLNTSDIKTFNVRSTNLNTLYPTPQTSPIRTKSLSGVYNSTFRRHRSPSPNCSLIPRDPNLLMIKPRRSSWQSSQERRSVSDLERECDEDDGDDIPDHLILDNVPISPRPPSERSRSQPGSKSGSPERAPKERVRSVGNGTPPVALAQGSLKSPTWKSDAIITAANLTPGSSSPSSSGMTGPLSSPTNLSPVKMRAKSWTAALADLSAEAKELTEKLEEHADEVMQKSSSSPQRSSTGSMLMIGRRSADDHYEGKPRHKSALPELPPLRRSNIMIDPLPISKEKEAVLSRTRPSWLPPKDPAEERRHLKEYQKMIAKSAEADRRREATKKLKSECKDTAVDSLMQIWEHDVLPRWNEAIRERRTRDLWWKGVAPRSRGAVWTRAIGNELGLTETSYSAALRRAREVESRDKAGQATTSDLRHIRWLEAIRRDVETATWTDLKIFQKGAPLHQSLVDVLSAYAMYRSDIGYLSGCNTIAALLLLNLPSATHAFIALANTLNRPLPLSFYAADPGAKASAYNLALQTLSKKSRELHDHLMALPDHDPDTYLGDLFTSLFTSHLPLDAVARLWDVYVFEGDAVLVRAAVALLVENEIPLLSSKSVGEVKAALEDGSGSGRDSSKKRQRVVGAPGEEANWIRAVREAGRS